MSPTATVSPSALGSSATVPGSGAVMTHSAPAAGTTVPAAVNVSVIVPRRAAFTRTGTLWPATTISVSVLRQPEQLDDSAATAKPSAASLTPDRIMRTDRFYKGSEVAGSEVWGR